MENIEQELQKERRIVHENRKVLRSKPAIFLQRYLYFFIISGIFLATLLFGLYDIRDIVLVDGDNQYVKQRTIESLAEEYLSKNFFLVNPEDVEKGILKNSYVKSVEVEKIFPNRLEVQVEEYIPFILFETENKNCKVFSEEGVLLEIKEEIDCEELSSEEEIIYFIGKSTQVIKEENNEYFYMADNIKDISMVLNKFDIKIKTILMSSNVFNITTGSLYVVMDSNQNFQTELARLYIVLNELETLKKKAKSVDVRFERPVIQIDN